MSSSAQLFNLYCKGKGFVGYPADEGYYDQDQEIDIAQAAWNSAWEAAIAQAVPEGWQTVPVEPTEGMLEEIRLADGFTLRALRNRYLAMLAAAPKPEGGA